MTKPSFLGALRNHESRTGIPSGFPSKSELQRLPYTVTLNGLDAVTLGYSRFRFVLHRCVLAAVRIAPLQFRHWAVYDGGERTGYEFRFATALGALRLGLAYQAAIEGRSCTTLARAQ